MSLRTFFLIIAPLVLVISCTKVPEVTDARVCSTISSRLNKEVKWSRDRTIQDKIHQKVQTLLSSPLSVDAAVQIALLNNQQIQAAFEELGIAQADLVEAGLFKNPLLEGFLRFPTNSASHMNPELSLSQSFMDVFLIPIRKKVAEAEFEQAHLFVSNTILNHAFEVQETFFSLVATKKKLFFLQQFVDACEAASALAKEQRRAGNINDLEMDKRINEALLASLAIKQVQLEIVHLKERMNILLGLSTQETGWTVQENLWSLPDTEIPMDDLEKIALSQRLDLEKARWEIERLKRMSGLTQAWAYSEGSVGVTAEQDPEGAKGIGPSLAGALPIFNAGQADRARLQSQILQSVDRLMDLTTQIEAEVHTSKEQLSINRQRVETYQTSLIPLHQQIVASSQRFYNSMTLGVYDLLDSKKQELLMQIELTLSLKDYWLSKVALNRSLGGYLPESTMSLDVRK